MVETINKILKKIQGGYTMSKKITNFFMYGTLKEGRPLDRPVLASKRTAVNTATIEGSIFNLGPYPTVKLDGKGLVIGEVHTFPEGDLKSVQSLLDAIEGYNQSFPDQGLYNRHKVEATLYGGKMVTAWVYEYNGSVNPKSRLSSGVWEPGL